MYWTKTSDNMWLLILVVSDMFDFHWFPTFFDHILPGSPMPQVDPLAHQTCPSPMRPWKFHCFHWKIWKMIGNDEWNSMEIMGNDGKTTNDEFFFPTGNDLRNPPSWTFSMTQRCLACHKSRSTAWLLSGFSRRKVAGKNKQLWAVGMLQWYSKLYANYMKQLNCLKSCCALPKTAVCGLGAAQWFQWRCQRQGGTGAQQMSARCQWTEATFPNRDDPVEWIGGWP